MHSPLVPFETISGQNKYDTLRRQILMISTASAHARANRIGSQMDYNQIPSTIDPLVKVKLLRKQRQLSFITHMKNVSPIIHVNPKYIIYGMLHFHLSQVSTVKS